MERCYFAIDLKNFFASVECVDRGLDPLTTNLVVADESKTEKTICLAVTPSLKALGVSGRPRLFEVQQQVAKINRARLLRASRQCFAFSSHDSGELEAHPEAELSFLIAPPRMAKYMAVSAQIYAIYLRYVAPEDIFAYSIDEVFIDATPYLSACGGEEGRLVTAIIRDVLKETGVTATAGIGTNLYLAKVALDILSKRAKADENGVRLARLNEGEYRTLLWDHKPLTDFWRIGPGIARQLERRRIFTMGDLARASLYDQRWFYKTFGIDAEILIDHAWGVEPTTMAQVQAYQPASRSICDGQVLSEPYPYDKTRIILQEMADNLMYQLMEKGMATDLITLTIGYDRENCDSGRYRGGPKPARFGRKIAVSAPGSVRLKGATNLGSRLTEGILSLFDRIADPALTVRRITLSAENLEEETDEAQLDFFTDPVKLQNEKNRQQTMMKIRQKYGKNAILKGINFREGATMRERNGQIGGHKA